MQKPAPTYSTDLVFHPERDIGYRHFEGAAQHPFEPDPANGVPRVNAWWLADAALLSYWAPEDAAPRFASAGLEHEYLNQDSTDCYLAWQDGFLIVAFRGTQPDDWGDQFTDFQLDLVPSIHGRVHRGFKASLDGIWPRLSARLEALSEHRQVWFCGHSLGAALAVLAADRFPRPRGICTFGSPRIGDAAFVAVIDARLGDRTLRYVNDHDIVTHVPPPIFDYRHHAMPRFIAEDGRVSLVGPLLSSFFADIFGSPQQLADIVSACEHNGLASAPVALLDHMPKAYAVWTWNDYDTNG